MNILVTGGATVAPIDDVRQITNASTGRFSAALSEAALRRGAKVWHLHAPGAILPLARTAAVDLDADPGAEFLRLGRLRAERRRLAPALTLAPLAKGTAAEYAAAVRDLLGSTSIDVALLAMAVSDYAPEPESGKLSSDADELILRCRREPKVIASVRDWAPRIFLVGFKLLSGSREADLIDRARQACRANRADLTIANDLQPLRAGKHTVHLVREVGPAETLSGPSMAADVIDRVLGFASAAARNA